MAKLTNTTINGTFKLPVGTTAQRASDTVNTFSAPGTFTVPSGVTNVEVLIVGGGGGGAGLQGGGGGAGGLVYLSSFPVTPGGSVPVTVGPGGTGGEGYPAGDSENGTRGNNSTFGTLTAIGGGGGLGYSATTTTNSPGGSGGGGGAAASRRGISAGLRGEHRGERGEP